MLFDDKIDLSLNLDCYKLIKIEEYYKGYAFNDPAYRSEFTTDGKRPDIPAIEKYLIDKLGGIAYFPLLGFNARFTKALKSVIDNIFRPRLPLSGRRRNLNVYFMADSDVWKVKNDVGATYLTLRLIDKKSS